MAEELNKGQASLILVHGILIKFLAETGAGEMMTHVIASRLHDLNFGEFGFEILKSSMEEVEKFDDAMDLLRFISLPDGKGKPS